MEIVGLDDLPGSFLSRWLRIANTSGHDQVQIGDRFREQGFGEGAEELEVDGVDFSPVGGASRLHVIRAGHATRAEVHRAGCVYAQTYAKAPLPEIAYLPLREQLANSSQAVAVSNQPENGISPAVPVPPQGKRGRGRPKGAKNKPKPSFGIPAWPGVR